MTSLLQQSFDAAAHAATRIPKAFALDAPELVLDAGRRTLVLRVLLSRVVVVVIDNADDVPWYRRGTEFASAYASFERAAVKAIADPAKKPKSPRDDYLWVGTACFRLHGIEAQRVRTWLAHVYSGAIA